MVIIKHYKCLEGVTYLSIALKTCGEVSGISMTFLLVMSDSFIPPQNMAKNTGLRDSNM